MIAKITRGSDVGGLIRYLLGPTRDPANMHEDQRVIAASEGLVYGREAAHDAGMREERFIALQMDSARVASGATVSKGHVWHLSLTNGGDDRHLDDDQWAAIARHTLEELGFDHPNLAPTPWVAIRHGKSAGGNEHVHIAVSLVREDGTTASPWQDWVKVSRICRDLERRYDLVVVEGRYAGAVPTPTRAESEIAARHHLSEPARVRLARIVRGAADASVDEAEFVRRLRARGIAARPRYAAGDASRVVGYAVAEPRPRGAGGDYKPRWFSGGKLAKDLSLPALRTGWESVGDQAAAWRRPGSVSTFADAPIATGRESRPLAADAWPRAVAKAREATDKLSAIPAEDTRAWARAARDASGAMAALATRVEPVPGPLSVMADLLARSAQVRTGRPVGARAGALANLATVAAAARGVHSGPGSQAVAWWTFAMELSRLAQAIQKAHEARGELVRARALRAQVQQLMTAGPPAATEAPAPDFAGPSTLAGPARRPVQPQPDGDFER